jgi:hypothetical protein
VVRLLVGPVLAIVRIVAATLLLALYFLLIHGFGGLLVRYIHRGDHTRTRTLAHFCIAVNSATAATALEQLLDPGFGEDNTFTDGILLYSFRKCICS